MLDSQMLNEAA